MPTRLRRKRERHQSLPRRDRAFALRFSWASGSLKLITPHSLSKHVKPLQGLGGAGALGHVARSHQHSDFMRGTFAANQFFARAPRLERAAAIVWSISASVCAAETKSASYCDGGRKTPRRSISWKNLPNRAVSDFFASV